MPFYPRNVASQGMRPTPSPFVVFIFRLVVDSIKELGGAFFFLESKRVRNIRGLND
jgi:hypothetical protein